MLSFRIPQSVDTGIPCPVGPVLHKVYIYPMVYSGLTYLASVSQKSLISHLQTPDPSAIDIFADSPTLLRLDFACFRDWVKIEFLGRDIKLLKIAITLKMRRKVDNENRSQVVTFSPTQVDASLVPSTSRAPHFVSQNLL